MSISSPLASQWDAVFKQAIKNGTTEHCVEPVIV